MVPGDEFGQLETRFGIIGFSRFGAGWYKLVQLTIRTP
jgi:hypothetical protein